MSRRSEKLTRNDLARQRQLNLDSQRKAERDVQIAAVQENQKSQGVKELIAITQIPYLSIMHIVSCLDNKSKIAYARVCKPMRESVMRNPIMIKKAVKEYHEECQQEFIHNTLIPRIITKEKQLKKLGSYRHRIVEVSKRSEVDSLKRQMRTLLNVLEKKDKSAYDKFTSSNFDRAMAANNKRNSDTGRRKVEEEIAQEKLVANFLQFLAQEKEERLAVAAAEEDVLS